MASVFVPTPCAQCHGEGFLSCVNGCHTTDCDECDGTGQLDENGQPTGYTIIVGGPSE